MTSPHAQLSPSDLERLFSDEQLSIYLAHCNGDFVAAVLAHARYRTVFPFERLGYLRLSLGGL